MNVTYKRKEFNHLQVSFNRLYRCCTKESKTVSQALALGSM